jgi:catechol 2,3-dioxygenase-like lactoylglutathione lyase family enzyme
MRVMCAAEQRSEMLEELHGRTCYSALTISTADDLEVIMSHASVRYIVDDVDAAVAFYTERLAFEVEMRPAPTFAMLSRGPLRLMLSAPTGPGGGAQPMPDGRRPEPGGWNRIQLEVDDLDAEVQALRRAGASFRNEIVQGVGGAQILLDDPSGNPIELFQRTAR